MTSGDGRKVKIFESKIFSNRLRGVGSSAGSFIRLRPTFHKFMAPLHLFLDGQNRTGGRDSLRTRVTNRVPKEASPHNVPNERHPPDTPRPDCRSRNATRATSHNTSPTNRSGKGPSVASEVTDSSGEPGPGLLLGQHPRPSGSRRIDIISRGWTWIRPSLCSWIALTSMGIGGDLNQVPPSQGPQTRSCGNSAGSAFCLGSP